MSRTFVLLVVVGVLLGAAISQDQQCPPNQEWTDCGSACPPSCINSDPHQPCTLQCVIGCKCKDGFLLDGNRDCVLPQNC